MDEPIHIRSQVSFAVMKIHVQARADHLTRISILKNTELPNSAAVLKWRLILRLAGNVGISDQWGKPKYFQAIVWSLKTKTA